MKNETKEFIDSHIIPTAIRLLKSDGFLTPVCFFIDEESNNSFVNQLSFADDETKAQSIRSTHIKAHKVGSDVLVYVTEAWMSTHKREEYEEGGFVRPSEDPERREAIVVTIAAKSGERMVISYPFTREEGQIIIDETKKEEHKDFDSIFTDGIWNETT